MTRGIDAGGRVRLDARGGSKAVPSPERNDASGEATFRGTATRGGGWAVLIGGTIVGGAMVSGGVAVATALSATWSARASDASFVFCISLALIAAALAAGMVSGDPIRRGRDARRQVPLWFGLGVAMVTFAAVAAAFNGGATWQGDGGTGAGALLAGTLLVLIQSGGEEAYLRGWFMPALARRWGVAPGIALSALLFAALHLLGGSRAPLTLVNMALGGVLFGVLAWRSGGIAVSIAAHFGWNWGEALLLGLDPNPGVGSFGAILNIDLTGVRWLGGSDEGLNASVPMTIILLALLLVAGSWRGGMKRGGAQWAGG